MLRNFSEKLRVKFPSTFLATPWQELPVSTMLSHGILKLEASPGEDQPLKQKSIRKGEKGKGKKKIIKSLKTWVTSKF